MKLLANKSVGKYYWVQETVAEWTCEEKKVISMERLSNRVTQSCLQKYLLYASITESVETVAKWSGEKKKKKNHFYGAVIQ